MNLRLNLFSSSFLLLGLLQTIGSQTRTLLIESEKYVLRFLKVFVHSFALQKLQLLHPFHDAMKSLRNPEQNVSTQT